MTRHDLSKRLRMRLQPLFIPCLRAGNDVASDEQLAQSETEQQNVGASHWIAVLPAPVLRTTRFNGSEYVLRRFICSGVPTPTSVRPSFFLCRDLRLLLLQGCCFLWFFCCGFLATSCLAPSQSQCHYQAK